MKAKVKKCNTVGNAYMVTIPTKYGKGKTVAIGLTEFEAKCLCVRLNKTN